MESNSDIELGDMNAELTLLSPPTPPRKRGLLQKAGRLVSSLFSGHSEANYNSLENGVYRVEVEFPTRAPCKIDIVMPEYNFTTTNATQSDMVYHLMLERDRCYGLQYDEHAYLVDWALVWASLYFLDESMFDPVHEKLADTLFDFRADLEGFINMHYEDVIEKENVQAFVDMVKDSTVVSVMAKAKSTFIVPDNWAILARLDSRVADNAMAYYNLFDRQTKRAARFIEVPLMVVAAILRKIASPNDELAEVMTYLAPTSPTLANNQSWILFGPEMMIPDIVNAPNE